jgi:hypothetical protein
VRSLQKSRTQVYYLYVASIVGKKHGNQTYYYLVTSARVDGKPRIVQQQYLGTSEEVMTRLSGDQAGMPERVQHKGFGDLAAVWTTLSRLQVAATIDEAVGARRSDAAASVGTHLALAIANWVVGPCSKLAFADWWATTAGPRFTKVGAPACDHRNFWDAMDALDAATLIAAERTITARMVSEFDLDLSALALDMTNFATFIDSANERAPIAQRGHAKQKRHDLRLVGLGLVVTRDGGIPVLAHAYAGNRPDVTQFTTILDELTARYGALADPAGLSVVFDAGQNSEANFAHLDASGLGWVGSLPPSDHPDLLAIPRPPLPDRRPRPLRRPDRPHHPRPRAGSRPPSDPDLLTDPARRPDGRVRPNPGQGHPRRGRTGRHPGPRQHPPAPGRGTDCDRRDHPAPLGRPGPDHRPDR